MGPPGTVSQVEAHARAHSQTTMRSVFVVWHRSREHVLGLTRLMCICASYVRLWKLHTSATRSKHNIVCLTWQLAGWRTPVSASRTVPHTHALACRHSLNSSKRLLPSAAAASAAFEVTQPSSGKLRSAQTAERSHFSTRLVSRTITSEHNRLAASTTSTAPPAALDLVVKRLFPQLPPARSARPTTITTAPPRAIHTNNTRAR